MADVDAPGEAPLPQRRVKLPLVRCSHEAPPGEELTAERVAAVLLEEEARTALGE